MHYRKLLSSFVERNNAARIFQKLETLVLKELYFNSKSLLKKFLYTFIGLLKFKNCQVQFNLVKQLWLYSS